MTISRSIHIWSIVIVALSYASIAFLFENPGALALLLGTAVVILLILRRSLVDVKIGLIVLALSALFEVVSVRLGMWQYPHADYLGVPSWIPIGWVLFVFFVYSLYALLSNTHPQTS
jgi:hypothetical protein